ncbi:MAG: tetratricopeptide repeat protein [Chitinophagaceae bacterium]|nr:tetratricopeptide repeat protein [Chitinophagaceae bacterium]
MERIEKLLSFLKDSPDDSFLLHALALEYIKEGNDQEARRLLEKVLERDPSYLGSYYQLAKLLERNGEIAGALLWYQRGMDVANTVGNRNTYQELYTAWEELSGE